MYLEYIFKDPQISKKSLNKKLAKDMNQSCEEQVANRQKKYERTHNCTIIRELKIGIIAKYPFIPFREIIFGKFDTMCYQVYGEMKTFIQ